MNEIRRWATLACFASVLLFVLAGCGGGGADTADADLPTDAGSDDDGASDDGASDLVDMADYSEAGTSIMDMHITVREIDNPEEDEDADCPFITPNDGIGTTFDHVNQDEDKTDKCKPEVNVIAEISGLIDPLGEPNAELRLRGASSRLTTQKSYRIKLNSKTDLWRGQRTFQFNKHPYDLTRIRNKLCFDLFVGMPHMTSLRTQFMRLHVDENNDQTFTDHGLYTHIEKVDKRFLASHGLDAEGTVYKAESFGFFRYADQLKLEDDPTYDEDAFEARLEVKEGSGDHVPLLAMLDALNDDTADFDQMFSKHFNEQNFLTWQACNILMGNYDTNSQNFFLYRPDASDVFYFIPWDYDGSLDFIGQPIEQGNDYIARWNLGVGNWWGSKLQNRYFRQPGAIAKLIAKMDELRSFYLSAPRILSLIDTYRTQVRARESEVPDLWFLPALDDVDAGSILAEFDAEQNRLPALIESHYQQFMSVVERPMPVYTGVERIGSDVVFRWDPSFDFQGDGITYDLEVATTPRFEAGDIVSEFFGLTGVTQSVPFATLGAGDFFCRVTIRDTKDPANNWQISFDSVDDLGTTRHGVLAFTLIN